MESHDTSFGDTVVYHTSRVDKTGHACSADHVTLLVLDHIGQESLSGVPVADQVDLEDLVEEVGGHVDNIEGLANTGVVEKDGWCAQVSLDPCGDLVYVLRAGDIALVEVYVLDCLTFC